MVVVLCRTSVMRQLNGPLRPSRSPAWAAVTPAAVSSSTTIAHHRIRGAMGLASIAHVRSRLDVPAVAFMVLLCAIWGFTQVTIKLANPGFSPLLQAGLRSAGSGLLLWAWSAAWGVPLFRRDGSFRHGALIAALFAVEFILIYEGLVLTTAARAVLFVYTAP